MRYTTMVMTILVLEGLVEVEDDLSSNEPLLSSGLLDSLDLVRLTSRLNEEFGVLVSGADLAPANFETCAAISLLLERLVAPSVAAGTRPSGR